ncbi:MAG: hypothetical protein Q8P45_03630 [Candidatus Harrisonbacteria bacterium]|nr:hypothetical protein [Candidatus Harrisonbacteria bacterium]
MRKFFPWQSFMTMMIILNVCMFGMAYLSYVWVNDPPPTSPKIWGFALALDLFLGAAAYRHYRRGNYCVWRR